MKENNFPHLPSPFMDQADYDHLYRNNFGTDELDWSEGDWQEIRLRPDMSAIEVYRMLPSAEKFEYGGHLLKDSIQYVRCRETSATTISCNHCTFHSHPTNLPGTEPDIPSSKDVYSFIKFKQLRAVTVGKELIWVLDKTPETIPVVEQLVRWEKQNMISVYRELIPIEKYDLSSLYSDHVLQELGLEWPSCSAEVSESFKANWQSSLQTALKIEVAIYSR